MLLRRARHGLRRLSGGPSAASKAAETATASSRSFFIESYGCAMNTSDSELVRSILLKAGHSLAPDVNSAGLILVNTCAIRENAEAKIWHRLAYFQSLRRQPARQRGLQPPLVGVLGCMAERLKDKLLDEESVDFVCGPDSYRDVPRIVELCLSTGQKESNTQLSMETYADISPVRETESSSAFVSIMRGCNNMCSFCIVPFTRGKERSRPMASIISEISSLVKGQSLVKEVCLLGQNVNGFHDTSPESAAAFPESTYKAAEGFRNINMSRKRNAPGARFADLLAAVSDISPELRVRFTSPHPKDFPDDVLAVIAERPNLCKSLHLPAQSGSSSVLERMRRGYTREAYLDLFRRAREIIPGVTISTDMITGFCGETEEEHQESVSLMRECQFDQAFMFAYSDREKTHAARTMKDDVPEEVKLRRLQEVIDVFRAGVQERNRATEWGRLRLVLIEGPSTRSTPYAPMLTGRTDGNKRVIFPAPQKLLPSVSSLHFAPLQGLLASHFSSSTKGSASDSGVAKGAHMAAVSALVTEALGKLSQEDVVSLSASSVAELTGKYALCFIAEASGPTLRGVAVSLTSAQAAAPAFL